MNIKLLGNRVLVEVEKKEEKTASGLLLAKTSEQGEITMGKVVNVGLGKLEDGRYLAPPIAIGDKVMFQYGTLILLEGKSYLLVNGDDIIMII